MIRTPFGLPPPISLRVSSLRGTDGRTRIGHPHSPFSLPMVPNPSARGEGGEGRGRGEGGLAALDSRGSPRSRMDVRGRGRRQEQRLPSSSRFALINVVFCKASVQSVQEIYRRA